MYVLGITTNVFFLISTCVCDLSCNSVGEDCFFEFQAMSPPPASSSFSLSIRLLGFFLCNIVKYK